MDELRIACARVARRAASVTINRGAIEGYAAGLAAEASAAGANPGNAPAVGTREHVAAFWLTLDAINFGSGWFPTLRKRDGRSGYDTISAGVAERFAGDGPWPAAELARIDARTLAPALGQDHDHPLLALFAASLRDLGARVLAEHGGAFSSVADAAGGSAVVLARTLGRWPCFADASRYQELTVPFLKRAQIAAADLARAGVVELTDLDRLTMFADNLVPHVLRLDGVLTFDPELVWRIDTGQLIEHDSLEEIEIRACALHAVELIVAAAGDPCAADVDLLLWQRGRLPRFKASPRHRARCTAY